MKQIKTRLTCKGLLIAVVILGLVAVAQAAPKTFTCVSSDKLEKEIDPAAELAEFSCFSKKYKGSESLHVKVTVKNVSGKDQRFRVNIFFENGKAVGGLLPRKTKKGLIKPGASASFVYPIKGMRGKPAGILLKISTMGP